MAETKSVAITIDKTSLTLVALALLVVVVVFQALQINDIKTRLAVGATLASTSSGSTTSPASASGAAAGSSVPSSLNDLPSMVGGC